MKRPTYTATAVNHPVAVPYTMRGGEGRGLQLREGFDGKPIGRVEDASSRKGFSGTGSG